MQRGRGGEPGQEGRVLDRVPGPVSAPAQHFVGPPSAEHDRAGQEDPGEEEEVPQRPDEVVAEAPDQERGAGEAEGNGHPHVARVEKRRVDHHQIVILQQWIGSRTVHRRVGHGGERLRRAGEEEAEEGATRQPHSDRVGHVLGVLVRIPPGGDRDVHPHDQAPEEDRSFERRPEADDGDPGRHLP